MSADLSNNQELALKKRARRRLVGAIALVLLMVIILPMVLQDRAALLPQEAIKITMPDNLVAQESPKVKPNAVQVAPHTQSNAVTESVISEPMNSESTAVSEIDKSENVKGVGDVNKEVVEVKKAEDKKNELKNEIKSNDEKVSKAKPSVINNDGFTIQVGVFSDMTNVKQLQARLKEIGLDSRTENISTPKGEKIRLKAGRFSSRQEAAYALTKLQAADLSGMVISNN